MEILDCIIVGGGPAGLNAAVVLGRCRRKILVFDTAKQRNRYSHGMHNYLTRDDILPFDFLQMAHKELHKYGVALLEKKITRAVKNQDGIFEVCDENNNKYFSKKLLIATGLIDKLPEIKGFKELYGKSVFHCPYCDGWEVRDKKIAVYAKEKRGAPLALSLKGWTTNISLLTDGKNKIKPAERSLLELNGIDIIRFPLDKLVEAEGKLQKIIFKNGQEILCDAIFFVNGYQQQCNLAETFGCALSKKGEIITNRHQQTKIEGLYGAGDADKDVHFVVVAAAEGAKAGVIINKELQSQIISAKKRKPGYSAVEQ
ncbi:MAG: NAD(P)/FAD-dependent oxidoreductase [Flavisolibacter sp.]